MNSYSPHLLTSENISEYAYRNCRKHWLWKNNPHTNARGTLWMDSKI